LVLLLCFAARTVRQDTDVPGTLEGAPSGYPTPMWLTGKENFSLRSAAPPWHPGCSSYL